MGSGLLKSLFRCIRGTADGRTSMTGHWHHVDHVLIDSGNVLDERDTTCAQFLYVMRQRKFKSWAKVSYLDQDSTVDWA